MLKSGFAALDGALEMGSMTYSNFSESIHQLAGQLGVAMSTAKDRDRAALERVRLALRAYQDAATFWREHIRFFSDSDNVAAYQAMPMKQVGLEWMISEYQLTAVKSDFWGIDRGVKLSHALERILGAGKERASAAFLAMAPATRMQPISVDRPVAVPPNAAGKECPPEALNCSWGGK